MLDHKYQCIVTKNWANPVVEALAMWTKANPAIELLGTHLLQAPKNSPLSPRRAQRPFFMSTGVHWADGLPIGEAALANAETLNLAPGQQLRQIAKYLPVSDLKAILPLPALSTFQNLQAYSPLPKLRVTLKGELVFRQLLHRARLSPVSVFVSLTLPKGKERY